MLKLCFILAIIAIKSANKHLIIFLDVVVFYHKTEIKRMENGNLICKLA